MADMDWEIDGKVRTVGTATTVSMDMGTWVLPGKTYRIQEIMGNGWFLTNVWSRRKHEWLVLSPDIVQFYTPDDPKDCR